MRHGDQAFALRIATNHSCTARQEAVALIHTKYIVSSCHRVIVSRTAG